MFKFALLVSILVFGIVTRINARSVLKERNNVQPSLKIINGKNVSISQYPFIASLSIDGDLAGAGIILNENWILTLAYSVIGSTETPSHLEFRVGSSDYGWYGQVVGGEKVIAHEKYRNLKWDYDIAVVRVNETITLGKDVQKAVLGSNQLIAGTTASVAGWGTSYANTQYTILAGNVTVLDFKTCKKTYGKFLTPRLFCSFDKDVSPCIDDWGDPMVLNGKVYGLYAGAFDCNLGRSPALYTNLVKFRKWITNAIKPKKNNIF